METPVLQEVERLLDAHTARGGPATRLVIGNRQAAMLEDELQALMYPVYPDPELIGMFAARGADVSWALEMWEQEPPKVDLVNLTGPATLYDVLIERVDIEDCLEVRG